MVSTQPLQVLFRKGRVLDHISQKSDGIRCILIENIHGEFRLVGIGMDGELGAHVAGQAREFFAAMGRRTFGHQFCRDCREIYVLGILIDLSRCLLGLRP